ncbi:hypothetical protein CXB51_016822 [Gossypium anomalum]|uniref:CCHC-type domain-containing protein n=1 Tax=Gossypium anomalum TaxID=47600 RepID=A0A8J6CVC6_9ROSI|nr:hypothetical protein CXB51_016822 [Gossypium anomalum]
MANRPDPDIDDDFSEIYKEYTGPLGSAVSKAQDRVKENKRSHAASNEEEEQRDPNAVPTDFTSREAKVWEAKSKATERNWKKRKEEEMICKICGESGHFTQGCPSTLGANRKSQDFFERVPARDPHARALFTEKVIQRIEKDIGCKIKMDEKFIIVSGKDRLILKKGVDAVHKVKDEGDQRGSSSSRMSRSRSPERSPVGARLRRLESQRAHSGPHNSPHFQQRFGRQDKAVEDRVREDLRKISRDSPQGRDSIGYVYGINIKLVIPCSWLVCCLGYPCLPYSSFHEAYGNDGARSRSSHSESPGRLPYGGNSFNSYDGHNRNMGAYRTEGWDTERRGSDLQSGNQFEYHAFPQTLDELELEFKREAMELGRIRDKEEDEENYKHRENIFLECCVDFFPLVHPYRANLYTLRLSLFMESHTSFRLFMGFLWCGLNVRDECVRYLSVSMCCHIELSDLFYTGGQEERTAVVWSSSSNDIGRGEPFHCLLYQHGNSDSDLWRQQQARQQMSASSFGAYKQQGYSEYDGPSVHAHYAGAGLPMDSRGRYPNPMENYSSRLHDSYGEFQRQRREDFGKAYNRY